MRVSSIVLSVFLAAGLGAGAASAQSLRGNAGPAETPPASFQGTQYVDSEGCVYIRAGYGGNVNWVPRVNRSRQVLCGYPPSLGGATTRAVAAAPAPQPTRPATTATAPRVTTQTAAQTTAQAGSIFRPMGSANTSGSGRAGVRTTATTVAAQPRRVVTAAPATRVVTAPAPTTRRVVAAEGLAGCAWATGRDAAYLQGSGLRCGPQANHPGDYVTRGTTSTALVVTAPSGPRTQTTYRPAWDDGRLNPARGPRTAAGDAQMNRVWTQTVPRRLVADVGPADVLIPTQSSRTPAAVAPRATVSTRSVAPAQPSVASGHRYLRAANYRTRAHADAAQAQLARQGIGAAIGQVNRADGPIFTLLAGPYSSPAALAAALERARAAGFANATTR